MHKRIIEPLLREVERMVIFEKFMVQSLAKRFFIFLGLKFNLSYKNLVHLPTLNFIDLTYPMIRYVESRFKMPSSSQW